MPWSLFPSFAPINKVEDIFYFPIPTFVVVSSILFAVLGPLTFLICRESLVFWMNFFDFPSLKLTVSLELSS